MKREKTPLLFASEQKGLIGIIAVADTIKPTSKEAISMLEKMGVAVTMLTGDNQKTAAAIQRQLGIQRVIAEVLPQEKEQQIARFKKTEKLLQW